MEVDTLRERIAEHGIYTEQSKPRGLKIVHGDRFLTIKKTMALRPMARCDYSFSLQRAQALFVFLQPCISHGNESLQTLVFERYCDFKTYAKSLVGAVSREIRADCGAGTKPFVYSLI